MQPAESARIISGLRCDRCRRAPTSQEVEEMVSNFGHKLNVSDVAASLQAGGQCLVWVCGDHKWPPTVAEKRAMRAERWAQWKKDALRSMTQQEIDELELSYEKLRIEQEKAIKTGKCPTCGAATADKHDPFGRPFTNVFCTKPRPAGEGPHFLIGVDDDELREMRAS